MKRCDGLSNALRCEILGVDFDPVTMDEAVRLGMAQLDGEGCRYAVTPNAEIVWLCRSTEGFADVLNGACLVLPDGIGVLYASRMLKRPLPERVSGVDFASGMMAAMAGTDKKLFLLGAKPGVAEAAAVRLTEQYPGLNVCGTHDGYFKDDGPVVEAVNASGADLVFVCLGAPKQELWMAEHCDQLSARLLVGLGGSLDVFSGQTKRAPVFWQKLGLEWLYRLLREPKRFGRVCRLPLFLLAALRARRKGE